MSWEQKKGTNKHLRVFMYGESGTGKTYLSLEFPNPGIIPFERGQIHYRDEFDFIELTPDTEDGRWNSRDLLTEIRKLKDPDNIPVIASTGKKIETLIIDTIGGILAGVQGILFEEQSVKIMKSKRPVKEVAHKDWGDMKRHYADFMEALDGLEMNVVVLGRMKIDQKTGQLVEFADVSTEYQFDMVLELRHLEGEHRKIKIWKDRTKHYVRHQEVRDPTYKTFFKPVFDDLQSGKTVLTQSSGGKPTETPKKPLKPNPVGKESGLHSIKKEKKTVKTGPKKKVTKKKTPAKKGKVEETDDYTKTTMTVDGKEVEYWSPKNAKGKRAFLVNIFNDKNHLLWSELNNMVGGNKSAFLPAETEDEDIDTIWEMLIENNSKITIE